MFDSIDKKNVKPSDVFQCKNCGECCNGYGGTYLTKDDITFISNYINTDPEAFLKNYCQKSGRKYILTQKNDGYCIFWDTLCTIHPVKPRMCKAWPFIESVLIDDTNWNIMAGSCSGIRTDISKKLIRKCVLKELSKSGVQPGQ